MVVLTHADIVVLESPPRLHTLLVLVLILLDAGARTVSGEDGAHDADLGAATHCGPRGTTTRDLVVVTVRLVVPPPLSAKEPSTNVP